MRIVNIRMAVLALLAMAVQQAWAWDIKVVGQEVSSSQTITDNSIRGKVVYDKEEKTLTLTDVSISAPNVNIIESNVEGLTIKIQGVCTLTHSQATSGYAAFMLHASTKVVGETVQADPRLNISNCSQAFHVTKAVDLSLQACQIVINNVRMGFWNTYTNFDLEFRLLHLSVYSTDQAMGKVNQLRMANCDYQAGSGYCFRRSYGGICDSQGNKAKSFTVETIKTGDYFVQINGRPLHANNYQDFCADGLDCQMSYNPSSSTLTLSNGTIDGSKFDGATIQNAMSPLTISVASNVAIKNVAENHSAIYSTADLTITTGSTATPVPGTEPIFSIEGDIYMRYGSMLTFDNARVSCANITGGARIDGSDRVKFAGTGTMVTTTTIRNFDELALNDGIAIATPLGAIYHPSMRKVVSDGNTSQELTNLTIAPVERYPITFGEAFINNWVADDILGDGTGSATYQKGNNNTGTLTLNNVNFSNQDALGTGIGVRGLRQLLIKVTGENTIEARNSALIITPNQGFIGSQTVVINGDGKLNLKGSTGIRMADNNSKLTIADITANIEATDYGIESSLDNTTATISNATATISGGSCAVQGLKEFNLVDCIYDSPADAYYDTTMRQPYTTSGGGYAGPLTIKPVKSYGFQVGGVSVNEANAADILGDGTATYADGMLTLNNANIGNAVIGIDIASNSPLYTISLKGTSTISNCQQGIRAAKYVTITGDATLNIQASVVGLRPYASSNNAVIEIKGYWTEKGPTVNIVANGDVACGIMGRVNGSNQTTVLIDNATVSIEAKSTVVGGLNRFSFLGSSRFLTHPVGAYFDTDQGALCYADGTIVADDSFVFEPADDYGIDVAGIRLNSKNYSPVVAPGVTGTVSYDPETNTLTMHNATIKADWAINAHDRNEGMPFTLKLIGQNVIEGGEWYGLSVSHTYGGRYGGSVITGNGILTISSQNNSAIYFYNAPININNATVIAATASSEHPAIATYGDQPVNINRATVIASGQATAIAEVSGVNLKGSEYIEPEGAAYSNDLKGVAAAGALTKTVRIERQQKQGDINNDLEVNVGDIMAIINVMAEGILDPAADINGDGEVNVGDIMAIINMMAGGNQPVAHTGCPNANHPHWIDLGLPSGTQWRCCNEGASTPEDYGGYYTFGQVGSAPTSVQIAELLNKCSYVWTTQNGVNGLKLTGPNGGVIFLPAAGVLLPAAGIQTGELTGVGTNGLYWSSTPVGEEDAFGLNFSSVNVEWFYNNILSWGLSVRPVR